LEYFMGFETILKTVAPTVLGGIMGDNASSAIQGGANAQVQANQQAIAEQQRAAAQQRADLMPWANTGGAANNELMRRLGVGGNGRIGSFTPKTLDQLHNEMRGSFTTSSANQNLTAANYDSYIKEVGRRASIDALSPSFTEYISGLNSPFSMVPSKDPLYSGGLNSQYDESALNAAALAAFNAQGAAREGTIDPQYGSLLKEAPAYKQFSQQDLRNDLVYQNGLEFGRATGQNAINQRAAAGGSYNSGAALKALTRFGNDYATTKTGDAYNRNLAQQTDSYQRNMAGKNQIYTMLSGQSAQGQSAAAGQGAAGLSSANNLSSLYGNIGNSQAAGSIGQANAWGNSLGNAANNVMNWVQQTSSPSASISGRTGFDRYTSGNLGSGD
jgi:hypothetical protein